MADIMSKNRLDLQEDLQIEISANDPVDLFAVMVTRSDNRVESVVCIPSERGRACVRKTTDGARPDPERFKSPIKDGRRSALGDRLRQVSETEADVGKISPTSGVRFIPDDVGDFKSRGKSKQAGQRFHLRIAYPNGFANRRTFKGACSKKSVKIKN